MEKEYYPVYEINICFEQWASDTVMVGAKSEKDLVEHIYDVFPDTVRPLNKYDFWALKDDDSVKKKLLDSDTDCTITVEDELFIKDGMVHEPYFTKKQFKEICKLKGNFKRIKKVKNLYTDKLYQIITSHGYYE